MLLNRFVPGTPFTSDPVKRAVVTVLEQRACDLADLCREIQASAEGANIGASDLTKALADLHYVHQIFWNGEHYVLTHDARVHLLVERIRDARSRGENINPLLDALERLVLVQEFY
jgi:hypothetical protein